MSKRHNADRQSPSYQAMSSGPQHFGLSDFRPYRDEYFILGNDFLELKLFWI